MNNVISPFSALANVSLNPGEDRHATGASPVNLEDLLHELRQPLSTIESLAYYLELTAPDDQICRHVQRIRSMVLKAHQILERAAVA